MSNQVLRPLLFWSTAKGIRLKKDNKAQEGEVNNLKYWILDRWKRWTHSLKLPQVELTFRRPLPETTLLMTAGGRPPENKWLLKIAKGLPVWCIDSGIHICRQTDITPERIIGDGDSASPGSVGLGRESGNSG